MIRRKVKPKARECVATRPFFGERLSPKPENSQFIFKFFACTPLARAIVGRQSGDQILDEGAPQVRAVRNSVSSCCLCFSLMARCHLHGQLQSSSALVGVWKRPVPLAPGPSVESRDTPTLKHDAFPKRTSPRGD